ncbi:uncharacterized protein LOC105846623 isoform X1 [Hydra vulgaris]|uniref:uncharacterized protein LOC105846623 isoform X1 n=1 Tax=Hydra vulgaris TaxID=6087 RepID=UPI0006413A8F|nr:uncharacterized protein LOC105846623 [Hydra vulgaris]
MLIKTVFIFGLVVFTTYSSEDKKDIPINDFAALVNDLKQALNLDRVFEVIHQYLKTAINNGQKYSYQQFKDDWRNLKVHPVDIAKFVHQSIWAIIVNGSLAIIKVFYYYHNFFLEYLKKKCDIYFEKIDPFHPWNVMEQENKQTPLYLFIYGGILSLVFMRFLSSWNFLLYIAASFLVHYIGGTPLVFKWILSIIGFLWFAFDIITSYPLHAAIAVVTLYFSRFILPWMAVDRMPHSSQILPERFRQNEIKTLQSRLKNMEEKTYLINERLERLYTLIDKKENE